MMTTKRRMATHLGKGLAVLGGILIAGWGQSAAYAATATADVTATLIQSIAIAKNQDLNFGTAAPGLTTGTVTMSPAGTRTATGDVVLSGIDAGTPASFTVTGENDATYQITLPLTVTLLNESLSTMLVTDFTSTPSGTGTLTGGTQTVNVGATLQVGLAQPTGVYSGTFDVTVEYN